MRMCELETLDATIHYVADMFKDWGDDGLPYIAKRDHKKAYRQWPVRPDHMRYVVCLVWDDSGGVNGGFRAYAHKAPPFGAFAAVWGYSRVAASVVHILQRL